MIKNILRNIREQKNIEYNLFSKEFNLIDIIRIWGGKAIKTKLFKEELFKLHNNNDIRFDLILSKLKKDIENEKQIAANGRIS